MFEGAYTFGTAGHVDHGKSTLVQTLTGINPDRWEEEQRREMTIDLGFAWFKTPVGREISLVDVPGHERFIKNMLAGVGGLDAVLFVVAADEGVQPQTVEHLQIIDLLGLEHGIIVLTKADLVDPEWLQLVSDDLHTLLHPSSLQHAPLIAVSARTGTGLAELQSLIDATIDDLPPQPILFGPPRLPIDRAFTIRGFGTVVTGTLLDGMLEVGSSIELHPGGLRGRVRGLQTHKQKRDVALPGSRVAVNISGIEHHEITRGMVLMLPQAYEPTTLLDVQLRLIADADAVEHNTPAEVFIGTAAVACHIALLDRERLEPGDTGWVQLRLAEPLVAARHDRCIVRRPSPPQTLGGGVVIDPHPQRHRRFREYVISQLETLAAGDPIDLLRLSLNTVGLTAWADLLAQAVLSEDQALLAMDQLVEDGEALWITPDLVATIHAWEALEVETRRYLNLYHQRWPLRLGINREELRTQLKLTAQVFPAVLQHLQQRDVVIVNGPLVAQVDWQPYLTPNQQRQLEQALAPWHTSPTTPPSLQELETLDEELRTWIFEHDLLVRINPAIAFEPHIVTAMLEWVQSQITQGLPITLASFRDRWNTTRKYAQAFLEYTDAQRITRRVGDERVAY